MFISIIWSFEVPAYHVFNHKMIASFRFQLQAGVAVVWKVYLPALARF